MMCLVVLACVSSTRLPLDPWGQIPRLVTRASSNPLFPSPQAWAWAGLGGRQAKKFRTTQSQRRSSELPFHHTTPHRGHSYPIISLHAGRAYVQTRRAVLGVISSSFIAPQHAQ